MLKRVVLGVSGSVAAYRACDLARELMRRGFEIRVCLTDSAEKFVTRALFEALTGNPCLVDTFEEPERGRMAHIDWARQADLLVIAPATANTLAKIAHGIGEDMLTTLAVAFDGPIVLAPAMNPTMYASESNQIAVRRLQERGAWFVEPVVGDVACGENGQGKFADVGRIADEIEGLAKRTQTLQGKKVLITSGPTQEPIDAARYISNYSSGKMGAALAKAALLMGGEVTVVSGPSQTPIPSRATTHRVQTAQQMLETASQLAAEADLIIGVAAVADYRPSAPQTGKIRRKDEPLTLELIPNPDIIAALAKLAKPGAKVIGFAAEPSDDPTIAREKLQRKGLAGLAFNDISAEGQGFGTDTNRLILLTKNGESQDSGLMTKTECAFWLLEKIPHIM